MKCALLSLAGSLLLFTPPALGGVPELNVTAICHARSADAKILHSIPDQSVAECVRDEQNHKQKLDGIWSTTAVALRRLCQSDARALGTMSYLDLFTCIQLAEDLKAGRDKPAER